MRGRGEHVEPVTSKSRTRKVVATASTAAFALLVVAAGASAASPIERQRSRRPRASGVPDSGQQPTFSSRRQRVASPARSRASPAEHRARRTGGRSTGSKANAPYSRCADPVGRVWPPPLAAADARPPRARRDLARPAGSGSRPGRARSIPIAGAIPYARPTGRRGRGGPLAHIPSDQEITAANARGSRRTGRPRGLAAVRPLRRRRLVPHTIPRARGLRAAVPRDGRSARRGDHGGRAGRSHRDHHRLRRPLPADPRVLRPSPRNTSGCRCSWAAPRAIGSSAWSRRGAPCGWWCGRSTGRGRGT